MFAGQEQLNMGRANLLSSAAMLALSQLALALIRIDP
jgi:hypothetical protein